MSGEQPASIAVPTASRSADALAAALLVAAVWAVYLPALAAPFVGDDSISIVENESLRRLWPLVGDAENPGPLAAEKDLPTAGRPLVNLSFALNYQLHDLDPRGYRAVNVLLHSLNVLLLAAIVRRTLRLPYFGGRFADSAALIAFSAALIWAVHPLVTETVEYVTQRTELMACLFYFATMYASIRYWERGAAGWLIAAVAACWAGMASKEVFASAPILVLLFDRTFFGRTLREAWQNSRPLYVGLFGSWLLLLCLAGAGPRSASAGFHLGVPVTDWWYTQSKMLLVYLKLAVWPWPLSIHYEPAYLTSFGTAWIYVLPVAILAAATLLLLWRRSAAGYLATFAFAILAPTFAVPIVTEIAAERRMYMPLAALLVLAVVAGFLLLRAIVDSRIAKQMLAVGSLALAVSGGAVSSNRLTHYADEFALWADVLAHQPNNATAEYNVGTFLLERDDPALAEEHFRRAIRLREDYPQAHHNLGAALSKLGRADEATKAFARAVELEPRYAMGHVKLGFTALKEGRPNEARRAFKNALDRTPRDADANRGMAEALLQLGELADAARHAKSAVDAAPNDAAAQNILGAVLAQQGNLAEAIEHFKTAVRLDPNMLQALGNLMAAYGGMGRSADAFATAEKALALARAAGDTALEEQIEMFLFDYRMENTSPTAPEK
jgi:protein O-mannosyl-transferase